MTRFLPSRRVQDLATKAVVAEVDYWSCCQGGCRFLKQVKGGSTPPRVQIPFMAVVAGRAVTGARGSRSIGASRGGQVWIRSVPSKVRSGFTPCPAGKLDLGSLPYLVSGFDVDSSGSKLGGGSKLWRWQQALEEVERFGGGSKL